MEGKDWLFELYQRQYVGELERGEKLTARVSILLTIYTILLGGTAFFLGNLPNYDGTVLIWGLYVALGGQVVSLFTSLVFAARFLFAENYAYVVPAQGIEDYIEELQNFNQVAQERYKIDEELEVENWLRSQYVRAATLNFEENNSKYSLYTRALISIVIAAFLGIISALPFFALKITTGKEVQKVEIVKIPAR